MNTNMQAEHISIMTGDRYVYGHSHICMAQKPLRRTLLKSSDANNGSSSRYRDDTVRKILGGKVFVCSARVQPSGFLPRPLGRANQSSIPVQDPGWNR